jgi:hypothetical protein
MSGRTVISPTARGWRIRRRWRGQFPPDKTPIHALVHRRWLVEATCLGIPPERWVWQVRAGAKAFGWPRRWRRWPVTTPAPSRVAPSWSSTCRRPDAGPDKARWSRRWRSSGTPPTTSRRCGTASAADPHLGEGYAGALVSPERVGCSGGGADRVQAVSTPRGASPWLPSASSPNQTNDPGCGRLPPKTTLAQPGRTRKLPGPGVCGVAPPGGTGSAPWPPGGALPHGRPRLTGASGWTPQPGGLSPRCLTLDDGMSLDAPWTGGCADGDAAGGVRCSSVT